VKNLPNGIYGDHIKQKQAGIIRILFQNPQGLGHLNGRSRMQTPKLTKLRDTMIKHNIDIVGLSEINKDWRKISQRDTMWNIIDGWFEYRRLIMSMNTMVSATSPTQYGATMLMAMNRIAYSIISADSDTQKLGRWSTFLCSGKRQVKIRIICAYCPCKSNGTYSTYVL
jgi:hypothetical protein